jgi:hypothetical protein
MARDLSTHLIDHYTLNSFAFRIPLQNYVDRRTDLYAGKTPVRT